MEIKESRRNAIPNAPLGCRGLRDLIPLFREVRLINPLHRLGSAREDERSVHLLLIPVAQGIVLFTGVKEIQQSQSRPGSTIAAQLCKRSLTVLCFCEQLWWCVGKLAGISLENCRPAYSHIRTWAQQETAEITDHTYISSAYNSDCIS
jgi:hypothetical protein